jgi:hypothetical protein
MYLLLLPPTLLRVPLRDRVFLVFLDAIYYSVFIIISMTLTNAIKSSGAEIVTNSDGYDHYILNLSPKKRHTGGNNDIIALVTGGAAKIAHENNKVLSIITGGSIKPKTQCDIRNLIMLGGAKPKRKIDYEKS